MDENKVHIYMFMLEKLREQYITSGTQLLMECAEVRRHWNSTANRIAITIVTLMLLPI